MKKIFIIFILLSGCSYKEKQTTSNIVIADNISGVVTQIDKSTITINRGNEIYTFEISDIDVSKIGINDEVSIIFNSKNNDINVVSVVLEKKSSEEIIEEGIGIIQEGTNQNTIVVLLENETLSLTNYDVPIKFEGDLIKGMKVKVTYSQDYILKSLDILEE